jgi:hypothetical protein
MPLASLVALKIGPAPWPARCPTGRLGVIEPPAPAGIKFWRHHLGMQH